MYDPHPRHSRAAVAAWMILYCVQIVTPGEAHAENAVYAEDVKTGFLGTDADDNIVRLGPLEVVAFMQSMGADYPIFGSGDFDGTIFAGATANGVLALAGQDLVVIGNPLAATADAIATGAVVSGSLTGDASADVLVNASATTVGVDGGEGDDNIVTGSNISADTSATATSASVAVMLDSGLTNSAGPGEALVNAGSLAESDSIIVAAGAGDDQVNNNGQLVGAADATATSIGTAFAIDVASGADVNTGEALSNSSAVATAGLSGIYGGAGADTINNFALIDLSTTTDATAVSVALSIAGAVRGDASSGGALSQSETRADSSATGIDGGSGDDTIMDTAAITVLADSGATAVSANYSLAVSRTGDVTTAGGVSDASVQATSRAMAIDGGEGDDSITAIQGSSLGITTVAISEAIGIAATFSAAGSVTGDAVGGEALSETRVDAYALATGIGGGSGSDTIISIIDIDTGAMANATGVSVGYSAGVGKEGSITAGAAASDASTLATSTATGIDGGDDDDVIGGENGTGGVIATEASSTAIGVSASFSVAGSLEGNAESGDALSKARTDADAQATAIAGGLGDDEITHASAIDTDAHATSIAVSASFSVGMTAEGEVTNEEAEVSGGAMSDSSSLAKARAAGLDGGDGDDTITSLASGERIIDVYANSDATGVAASFNVGGGVKGAAASGDALSSARTDADAVATGIIGGNGNDDITSASGIDAETSATATAVSAGFSVTVSKEGDVSSGAAISDASSLASASSTGIDGGVGDDTITTMMGADFAIETLASSEAYGVAASFTVAGSAKGSVEAGDALSVARTDASAVATGIGGGAGADTIIGDSRIDSTAESDAVAVSAGFSVSVTADGDAIAGAAISDASSFAQSQAFGIDGGEGKDIIGGERGILGSIKTLADANATGVAASFTIAGTANGDAAAGDALSEARADADALAAGISGGAGDDRISVLRGIDADAIAQATAVSAGFSVEITKTGSVGSDGSGAAALSDASSLASARAAAIVGGAGEDKIRSSTGGTEVLDVFADAGAVGVAASVTISGRMQGDSTSGGAISDASTTAQANAVAIDGGSDDDEITNSIDIIVDSDASTTSVAVGISVGITVDGDASGAALSDARAIADATATGIDGGTGNDTIFNAGRISIMDDEQGAPDSESDATATAVAVSIDVVGTASGEAEGMALSDSSGTATATGIGIAGDAGADSIDNLGAIVADVGADSTAVSVSGSISVSADGDATAAALSDSSATSQATATGIDGGDDDDDIDNLADLDIRTTAESDSVSVSVTLAGTMSGSASGASIADSSATSSAYSTGIGGGSGDDLIDTTGRTFDETTTDENEVDANQYQIYSSSTSDAAATAVSVTGAGSVGDANAAAVADASANGSSFAIGIDGGAGRDIIDNASRIDAVTRSSATANTTTVTVAIGLGETGSLGTGDSSATAISTAIGIGGGEGDDTITNTADIFAGRMSDSAMAEAEAGSTSVTVSVTVGAASSETSANAAALAEATAAAISGGSGDDTITNSGTIVAGFEADYFESVAPQAIAIAGSQTVDIGVSLGDASSDASSDSSATAISDITGIMGGAGSDTLTNKGWTAALSGALAKSESTTTQVKLSLGASEGNAAANATSQSTAIAAGMDGGSGDDWIITTGELYVAADAHALTKASSLNLSILNIGASDQSATASGSSTADAVARGLHGDAGGDTIDADGHVTITATADVSSEIKANVKAGFGVGDSIQRAQSSADTTARSLAIGIDGGSGDDTITDNATLRVFSTANAVSKGDSATNSGFNLAGSSTGESMSDARATVDATGVGIRGGEVGLAEGDTDSDTITASQVLTVSSLATGKSNSSADTTAGTVFGSADGRAISDASAVVLARGVGIEGGAGADTITTITVIDDEQNESRGDITVTASAKTEVISKSTVSGDVTFGSASTMGASNASVDMLSDATGIDAGAGDDTVTINTVIDLDAISDGAVTSTSNANADTTFGNATSGAVSNASAMRKAKATGILGGEGADTIVTSADAEISVTALSSGAVTSTSNANADTTFGDASSNTVSAASSEGVAETTGIAGGDGDDDITNLGRISASSGVSLTVTSRSVSIAETTFGDAFAGAASDTSIAGRAASTGITGGAGLNSIDTQGAVSVNARSNTHVKSTTVALAKSFWGNAETVASSSNSARGEVVARGIEGGVGIDNITTGGQLAVAGESSVTVDALTVSGSGDASSDARTLATADVSGIRSGDGEDVITSNADVLVAAAPKVGVSKRTFGKGGHVDGDVGIILRAEAVGIDAGAGADTVTNDGSLLVVVGRQADSTAEIGSVEDIVVLVDSNRIDQPEEELVGKWVRIDLSDGEVLFTLVEAFDPATGTMTTRDPLPAALAGETTYTMFDVDDGSADIAVSTVDIGGRANVSAATEGIVEASGIAGGGGDDTITNNGDVTVRVSNRTIAGSRTVAGAISADLSTRSTVWAIGIDGGASNSAQDGGADTLDNFGTVRVDAVSGTDFGSAELSFVGLELTALGEANASAIGMRGGAMGDSLASTNELRVASVATILAEDRATSYLGNIQQRLEFSANSSATGMAAGDGDDTLAMAGSVAVSATSQASVVGYSRTTDSFLAWLGIFQKRSTNVVDASLRSIGYGLDLGSGSDNVSNAGQLEVRSSAVPVDVYVAQADSTGVRDSGARATAINTATSYGIIGANGAPDISNSGDIDVMAQSVATSFVEATDVLVADDQSAVTAVSASNEFIFEDSALIDSTADFVGKEVRFLDASIEYERRNATVTALNTELENDQFADSSAIELDPAEAAILVVAIEGTQIRFVSATGSDPDYVGVVENFDPTNGIFTLADPLPTDENGVLLVTTNDNYVLSVLTATVTDFDASTGTFTLDEVVPDGVNDEAYTLSIVSSDVTLGPGSFMFIDASRQSEDPATLVSNWVSFANQANFVGFIESFDPASGLFTLRCEEGCETSFEVAAGDIYELSLTRDGSSGSTAIAYAYGIDLGGGGATLRNSGSIEVTATANASTTVNARYGSDSASADAVAEAIGIRTGDGDDDIASGETASINVSATVSASSNIEQLSATALATGIETGDGNDLISNAGTLTVTAEIAGAVDGGTAAATGISTGSGNDIVSNLGAISAVIVDNGIASDGLAIDLGEGDDHLLLGADSSTVGTILLGQGDDRLSLTGNVFTTSLSGDPLDPQAGEGSDTLSLVDFGSFAAVPTGFERTVKSGAGSFILTTLPTMQYLRVEDGELVIGSDYVFAPGSRYETVFYSDGHSGRLFVDGLANFAGAIDVERSGDSYISDGTRYELIAASDSITGSFTDIVLPDTTPLLSFELDQDLASLDLVAVASPFEDVAENTLQKRVTSNLDMIAGNSDGTFSETLGNMQTLSGEFGRAIESFSPDVHQVVNEGATKVMQQNMMLLQSHLRTSRSRYRDDAAAPPALGKLALQYNSGGYGMLTMTSSPTLLVGGAGVSQIRSQAWMLGMTSKGNYDAVDGYTGFDQETDAYAAGYDFRINDRLVLGLSAGSAETELEMFDAYGTGMVDAWFANAYGSWFRSDRYVEWGLGYAAQDIDTTRLIEIGTDSRVANSTHEGNAWSAFVGAGWSHPLERITFEPFVSLRYFRLSEDAFEETGAADLNQTIAARNTSALFGEIGVNIGQRIDLRDSSSVFDWNLMFGANHDFDVDKRRIDYAYVGQPDELLSLNGRSTTATSALLGGTLAWYGDRFGMNLEYRGRFNSDYEEQAIAAFFLLRF